MKKTLLIDSNNLIYRIYYMNKARGTDVNTLLVYLRCIKSYVDLVGGVDELIAVWDSRLCRGQPNFRRVPTAADYKGNRDRTGLEEAHAYDEQIQRAVESLGGNNMFPRRMEADDVIAWITHTQQDREITIVTVDKDMYQLINEHVSVYTPIKKIMVNNSNFTKITGCEHQEFLHIKALTGDKSDNIPGVPRVGDKTAKKIYKNGIEGQLTDENFEIYKKNLELMELKHGYTVHDHEIESYQEQFQEVGKFTPNKKKFKQICLHNAVYDISNNVDMYFSSFEKQQDKVPNVVNLISELNIGR